MKRGRRVDIEIHDNRILSAAHHDGFHRFILTRVDFPMGHEGWHIDEVAGAGFVYELEALAPAPGRLSWRERNPA